MQHQIFLNQVFSVLFFFSYTKTLNHWYCIAACLTSFPVIAVFSTFWASPLFWVICLTDHMLCTFNSYLSLAAWRSNCFDTQRNVLPHIQQHYRYTNLIPVVIPENLMWQKTMMHVLSMYFSNTQLNHSEQKLQRLILQLQDMRTAGMGITAEGK